jgi:CubicO group peptidase (beta-lactamase class C family)
MEQPRFAGSISKLITAVSVLRLVGEGAIKLADSANSYLGSVRVASNMVTIEQLLTHTSGVSSDFVHYKEKAPAAAELLGESVAVEFRPGSKHAYSNGGYAVLGEIIASVHGLPYGEAVSRAVLEPLGMRASSFVLDWPADAPRGYVIRAGKLATAPELVPTVPSAGGLYTTVRDLAKFVMGWRSLLPAGLWQQALPPHAELSAGAAQGYGWFLVEDGNRRLAGHGGGTLGFSSSLWWDRDAGRASIVLVNREHGPAEPPGLDLLTRAL